MPEKLSLKQARMMRDISQIEMAKRLDVHPQTYSMWEKEPNKISIGKASQICKILEVRFEDIFL